MAKKLEFSEYVNKELKGLDTELVNGIINNEIHSMKKYHELLFKRWVKSQKTKKTAYLYMTLSPDKKLRNLPKDATEELYEWCKNWFEYNPKYYGNYAWVIEMGSGPEWHLHVHAVVELKSSHKHAEKLKRSWARTFPKSQLLTTLNLNCPGKKRGEYAYLTFYDEKILSHKLDYFINERKGTHTNMLDLGLRGSRGFLIDDSASLGGNPHAELPIEDGVPVVTLPAPKMR